jgi:hypothetical protein
MCIPCTMAAFSLGRATHCGGQLARAYTSFAALLGYASAVGGALRCARLKAVKKAAVLVPFGPGSGSLCVLIAAFDASEDARILGGRQDAHTHFAEYWRRSLIPFERRLGFSSVSGAVCVVSLQLLTIAEFDVKLT